MSDVHTEHCCAVHGCKYGDPECTVAMRRAPQSYPCEECESEDPQILEILKAFREIESRLTAIEKHASALESEGDTTDDRISDLLLRIDSLENPKPEGVVTDGVLKVGGTLDLSAPFAPPNPQPTEPGGLVAVPQIRPVSAAMLRAQLKADT